MPFPAAAAVGTPRFLDADGHATTGAVAATAALLPGKVVNWAWFPILLYEVPLGIWLIRKGVRATT